MMDMLELDDEALRRQPLPMPDEGDKEARGRVLVIAGSLEIPGAAVLAATAALRAGAGKVAIASPKSVAQSIAFAVPESRVFGLPDSSAGGIAPSGISGLEPIFGKVGAVLIGPGLPYDSATVDLAAGIMDKFADVPLVLDAGSMSLVTSDCTRFRSPVLLTPHAGEMASLAGSRKSEIEQDAQESAVAAAKEWNAFVALKGAITYIATPQGRVWRHQGGSIGLATSGSGDVLAGIIAGLAARGAALEHAALWGVALHARAGARLAKRLGPLGLLAREIAGEVPQLMAELATPSSD